MIQEKTLARLKGRNRPKMQVGTVVYVVKAAGPGKWNCVVYGHIMDNVTDFWMQELNERDLEPATPEQGFQQAVEIFEAIYLSVFVPQTPKDRKYDN